MRTTDRNIKILDTTLRDGEQTPGVAFNIETKVKIASLLMEAGVDEIEAGIPMMGDIEIEAISEINKIGGNSRVTSWIRACETDIKVAERCGNESLHISFPLSDIQLATMGKEERWPFEALERIVPMALNSFRYVSVGALDATRCSSESLKTFSKMAFELGAYRLRIADTVGVATPIGIYRLFKELVTNENRIEYEFHGHNDLNMSVANSVSAVDAGATTISSTINGIGERAGNAATEEVVAALKYGTGRNVGVDLKSLMEICSLVEKRSGIKIHNLKPITGRDINNHESGIHVNGLLKNPLSFQPFDPEDIGRGKAAFVAGKHSGSSGIRYFLEKNGFACDEDIVRKKISELRKKAEEEIRYKSENIFDMENVYRELELL